MGGIEGHIIGGMVFLNHGANRMHFRVCLLFLIHWPSVNFAMSLCLLHSFSCLVLFFFCMCVFTRLGSQLV